MRADEELRAAMAAARAEARALRRRLGEAPARERGAVLAALADQAGRLEELHRARDRARSLAAMARLGARRRGHGRPAPGAGS